MRGLMQERPLLVADLIRHAARSHGDTEIVSREIDGAVTRHTYGSVERRARRLAQALGGLGIAAGDRLATLAWNNHRHFELYYGISGSGAICHTINPRLFFEQIAFICRHARDRVVFFDLSFVDLVARLKPECPFVEHWIALCEERDFPGSGGTECYETLLARGDDTYRWPTFDENAAASLCYTSGTTGDPKGVVYSHRSIILHSYAAALPDSFALSARDVVMPASSMYHANAWGVPHAATLVGAELVLPGRQLDAESLVDLLVREGVTMSCGVPTIWLAVARHLDEKGSPKLALERVVVAGSACPPALAEGLRRHGIAAVHLWGMTETSPLGTVATLKQRNLALPAEAREDLLAKQGRAVLDEEGWFNTGDVATIDADGFMRITDRSKDLIKSGGEWISSVDLENAAVGHPAVLEAAVVGVRHPKWEERPLLLVVPRKGATVTKPEMLDYLKDKVAKWWLPDDVLIVDDIPHTATGKILKTELRARHADHLMRTA